MTKWVDNEQSSNSSQADSSEEGPPISEDPTGEVPVPEESESDRLVIEAGQALLQQWSTLKEVFKIPKKDKVKEKIAESLMSENKNRGDRKFVPYIILSSIFNFIISSVKCFK